MAKKKNKEEIKIQLEGTEELQNVEQVVEREKATVEEVREDVNVEIAQQQEETILVSQKEDLSKEERQTLNDNNTITIGTIGETLVADTNSIEIALSTKGKAVNQVLEVLDVVQKQKDGVEKDTLIRILNDVIRRINILF